MCTRANILRKLLLPALAVAATACGRGDKSDEAVPQDILLTVNDSSLTLTDVLREIPTGIAPEDSAEMFRRAVEGWTRRMVLREVAEKNIPDMASIDEMVERYRDNLIVDRYLSMMEERGAKDISEERLKRYYEANEDMMELKQPLIKGIFVKTSSSSPELAGLRRWMASATPSSVDHIEKHGLRDASQYEYFMDRWMPWNAIAGLIPYRFYDADAFVSSTPDFETEYAGSVYLLKITEFLRSGERAPYEYARTMIRDILRAEDMDRYRRDLLRSIYTEARDNGVLRPGLYDPVKGTLRRPVSGNTNEKKVDKK